MLATRSEKKHVRSRLAVWQDTPHMKRAVSLVIVAAIASTVWLAAQPAGDPLDDTEHRMLPFIEKFRSIKEAVTQFGRI